MSIKIEAAARLSASQVVSQFGKTATSVAKYFMGKYKGKAVKAPPGTSNRNTTTFVVPKKDVVGKIEVELEKDGWKQQDNHGAEGHHWVLGDWKAQVSFNDFQKQTAMQVSYPNPKFGRDTNIYQD